MIVNILFSLFIFLFGLKTSKSFFSIGTFNAFLMFLLISGCYLFFSGSEYPVYFFGVFVLCLFSLVLIVGETIGCNRRTSLKFSSPCYSAFNSNRGFVIYALFCFLSFLQLFITMRNSGVSLSSFFDLNSFLEMNLDSGARRYSGADSISTIVLLLNCFTYATPFLGGFLFLYSKRKGKVLCLLSFIPVFISLMMSNAKLQLVACSALFFVGILFSYRSIHNSFPKPSFKIVFITILIGLVLLITLALSMSARMGSFEYFYGVIRNKIGIYAFGEIQSFSLFFEKHGLNPTYSLGAKTFVVLFGNSKVQGVYEFMNGAPSNVYTAYRGLIDDYGLLGSLLIVLIIGIIYGKLSRSLSSNYSNRSIKTFFLATIYFMFIFNVLNSPWVYTTFYIVFLLIGVFLFASFRQQKPNPIFRTNFNQTTRFRL